MKKRKFLHFLAFYIVAGLLIYSWIVFLFTDISPTWRHYVALALFIVPALLYFKHEKAARIATGCYLLLGITNILSMTPDIHTIYFGFGAARAPNINLVSALLLLLHYILNFDLFSTLFREKKEQETGDA